MSRKKNREIRKLKRADLQGLLIEKNLEVRARKQERDFLIEEVRRFQKEFDKVGSADAILNRMGVQVKNSRTVTAIEALLNQYENEESVVDIF